MIVTAIDVLLSTSGDRRGRICRRPDNRFQFVTETRRSEDAELFAHWVNDHPPSGLFDSREAALEALQHQIPSFRPVTCPAHDIEIGVGPYPEPEV